MLAGAALSAGAVVAFSYNLFQAVRWTRRNCPRCGRELYVQLLGNAKRGLFALRLQDGDDAYYICHPCRKYFLIEGRTDG